MSRTLGVGMDPIGVVWVCHSPSPYNDFLFSSIASDPRFELQVVYRFLGTGSHPWVDPWGDGYEWRIATSRLSPRIPLRKSRLPVSPVYVVGGWGDFVSVRAMISAGASGRDFYLWTDTPNLSRKRHGMRGRPRSAWVQLVLGQARGVMGTGLPALNALERMGVPSNKLVNFPYWVPIPEDRLDSTPGQRSTGTARFLSIGRIDNKAKGHDVAVRALVQASLRTGREFVYRIAGEGPDADAIRGLAAQMGVQDRVQILGWLGRDHLINELEACDAVLHPSPSHEPYGVAVLDAMANGRPVLASNLTGAGLDRIDHGANGLLHAPGNVSQLAVQLEPFLVDASYSVQLGRSARATAEQWPVSRALDILHETFRQSSSGHGR